MLKKSLLCAILIAAATPVFGQNWTAVIQPLDNTITGVSFINADTGFIITDQGEFARTNDAAATWTAGRIAPGVYLEDISFANGLVGVACGKRGALYYTSDGGQSWHDVSIEDTAAALFSVQMFDPRTGLVIGMSTSAEVPYSGVSYRTTDGGKTWQSLKRMGLGYSEIFYDKSGGVFFPSFGQVHHSSDFGKSWQTVKIGEDTRARDIAFTANTGIMVGPKGFCTISTDGGKTWTPNPQSPGITLVAVELVSDTEAYAGGLSSTMLRTTDTGKTWAKELMARSFSVHDMCQAGGRLYAVGSDGAMVYKNVP